MNVLLPLKEMMHSISSGLLLPTIAVLLFMLAVSVVELGSLLTEALTERRKMKVDVSGLLNAFQEQDIPGITQEIESSQLFRRHKAAQLELIEHRYLPAVSLQALARRLLAVEELHYVRITNRTDLVTRLGPMLGLMATLIPLGPGLMALGEGDPKGLADALLTAFDATVTGLTAGGIAYAVSRWRKRWYEDYLSTLESLMESLTEVLEGGRGIEEKEPLEA